MRKRKLVHANPSGYYWQTARAEYYVILDTEEDNEYNLVRLTIVKNKPKATTFFYVVQSSDAKKKRS